MKRVRLQRWSGQLLASRSHATISSPSIASSTSCRQLRPDALTYGASHTSRRHQSSAAIPDLIYEDAPDTTTPERTRYPSPLPSQALSSAKLAALHARLSLPQKIPLQTLARALVDATADEHPNFNNSNLAFLGQTLINYHTAEWLMCRYPRLPMMILYSAMNAYAGSRSLHRIAKQWGLEYAAAPGDEVDPGLLQFDLLKEKHKTSLMGYQRPEAKYNFKWRHGISSRVVQDDDFGDLLSGNPEGPMSSSDMLRDSPEGEDALDFDSTSLNGLSSDRKIKLADRAHADAVRAVVGAVYAHCGREAVKTFVKSHVLSRTLDLASLFHFKLPTRELANLCARESFEPPVARLLSETGRLSRTPVYVVGIFSGKDKLGEGSAANLDGARMKAAMNALKAWYLYSPGQDVRVPSDMLVEGAKPWEPAYVDIGEVI